MVTLKEGQIGGITILDKDGYGVVNASNAIISNLSNPVDGYDAATKYYVDTVSAGGGTTISVTSLGSTTHVADTITVNGGAGPESGSITIDLPHIAIGAGGTISIGENAMDPDTASQTVTIGYNALSGSGASSTVAIGYGAMSGAGGGNVVAIGTDVMNGASSGSQSVVIGSSALTSGSVLNTVVIGAGALNNGNGGNETVLIGRFAGGNLAPGAVINQSVVIGYQAMGGISINPGDRNVAIGYLSSPNVQNSSSTLNTWVGPLSGPFQVPSGITSRENVHIGYVAGQGTQTSNNQQNVFIGAVSGLGFEGGDYNVVMGSSSGGFTTGSANVLIGYSAVTPTSTISNYINIGNVFYGSATPNGGSGKAAIHSFANGFIHPTLDSQTPELLVYGTSIGDEFAPLGLITTGSEGAEIDFYVGTRNPDGVITPDNAGDIYVRSDGYDSSMYQFDGYSWIKIAPNSLTDTLSIGNITGGYDIQLSSGDIITGESGEAVTLVSTGSGIFLNGTTGIGITTTSGGMSFVQSGSSSGEGFSFSAGNGVSDGGSYSFTAGDGGTGDGGQISFTTGSGGTNSDGGQVLFTLGNGSGSGAGGSFTINAGSASGVSDGGNIYIAAGSNSSTGDGGSIFLTPGSSSGGAAGTVRIAGEGIVFGDFTVDGKLTVTGLIDPTGMVFDTQASVPGGTPTTNKGTIWVRSSDDVLVLTNDAGIDQEVGSPTSTDGYGDNVGVGFTVRRIKKFTNPLTTDPVTVNVMTAGEFATRTSGMSGSFVTGVKVYAYICDAVGSGGTGTAFIMGSAFGALFTNPIQSTQDHTTGGTTISIDYDSSDGIGVTCTPPDAEGYIWVLDVEIIVSNMADFNSLPDLP